MRANATVTRTLASCAVLLVLAGAGACRPVRSERIDPARAPVLVQVDNRDTRDAAIYVLTSSARQRLGVVTGLTSATFEMPRDLVQPALSIQLLADALGARQSLMSETVTIRSGLHLEWTIEAGMRRGSLTVF